jgi:hypothetical protein
MIWRFLDIKPRKDIKFWSGKRKAVFKKPNHSGQDNRALILYRIVKPHRIQIFPSYDIACGYSTNWTYVEI